MCETEDIIDMFCWHKELPRALKQYETKKREPNAKCIGTSMSFSLQSMDTAMIVVWSDYWQSKVMLDIMDGAEVGHTGISSHRTVGELPLCWWLRVCLA